MHRRETERLLAAIRQAQAAPERVALATVVRVKGSAYRREGTRMLVRQNGTFECALSGGCLEPAVAEAALRVIETGEPRIVSYDLADDSLWGLGMGCSGAVDVRIERLDDDDAMTREWLDVLERGEAAVLATPLSGTSGRVLVRGTGEIVGGLADAGDRAGSGRSRPATQLRAPFPQSGPVHIGSSEVFFEISAPPPELVIFGAGPDTVPLAQQATMLDFAVTDRRCPRGVPDGRSLSRRHARVRPLQSVRRRRPAACRQLRARDESPRRARSGKPSLRSRFRGRVHRRARTPLAVPEAARRPGGARLRPARVEPLARAEPGGPLARRGDTRGSGGLHPRAKSWRFAADSRAGF